MTPGRSDNRDRLERFRFRTDSGIARGMAAWVLPATVVLAVCSVALGCSGTLAARRQSELEQLIRARGLAAEQLVFPDRLTADMRKWLDHTLPPRPESEIRMFDLVQALENRKGVAMTYVPGYTGTAAEVFETGQYNCLSYSHLFLAMAREMGVDASYYEVDRSRRFRREGDVILVSGHVTVGFGNIPSEQLIKFTVRTDADYRSARRISDLTALGLFYANRGSELIADAKIEEAREWLEIAVRLAPHLPGSWVNLGVARRRLGDLDGAEAAYLKAIEVGDQIYPAYRNLASLYQVRGEREMRAQMMNLLGGRGNRNPYTWLALGDHSLEEGRLEESEEMYQRALRLSTEPAEPLAALGVLAFVQGDRKAALRMLEKARANVAKRGAEAGFERVEELEARLFPERALEPPASEIVIE